jgi:hypothetical protein
MSLDELDAALDRIEVPSHAPRPAGTIAAGCRQARVTSRAAC